MHPGRRSKSTLLLLLACIFLKLYTPPDLHAESLEQKSIRAAELFQEGSALYGEGEYGPAAGKFEECSGLYRELGPGYRLYLTYALLRPERF